MLAMIVATSIMLGGALLFACWYMATQASFTGQQSAIDSSALAAAHAVGRIVIDTPEFGYVALCDEAPTGTSTKAQDNYFTHVKSINELMASSRLCNIIADEIGDPFIKQLAEDDRENVLKVKDQLVQTLRSAMHPGQFGYDRDGQKVFPYDEALKYYLQNAGPKTKYVEGSMQLTLGCANNGLPTAVPVPTPATYSNTAAGLQSNGFYKSDTNIPYSGKDYVFAAVGREPSLMSNSKFVGAVAGLPFQMPAVVRVTARQNLNEQGRSTIVNYQACATAGRVIRSPTPGAIAFSFPDGDVAELKRPKDLRTWDQMQKTCDLLTSVGGDFPVDKPGAQITDSPRPWNSPWPGLTAPAKEVVSASIYDWLRAGGATVNVESVKSMMTANWDYAVPGKVDWKARAPGATAGELISLLLGKIPAGIQHRFSFNPDGTIEYKSVPIQPQPYIVAANNQLYAENPGGGGGAQAMKSNKTTEWRLKVPRMYLPTDISDLDPTRWTFMEKTDVTLVGTTYFDLYVRDMLRQPGAQSGGKHHGTPMDGQIYTTSWLGQTDFGSGGIGSGSGSGGRRNRGGSGRGSGGRGGSGGAPAGAPPVSAPPNPGGGGAKNPNKGRGLPPMVSAQDDFATTTTQPKTFLGYSTGPGSGAARPTYTVTGTVADIRFRREIDIGALGLSFANSTTGYIGEMLP
jgi:hypothetical protein